MVLLTIAVVAGVSAVVAGVVSGGLGEPAAPIPARALPDRPLTGQDIADLRFVQALRGYRMDQVDAAMDSLAAEVERLRRLLPAETAAAERGAPSAAPAGSQTDLTAGTPGASAEVLGSDGSDWPAGWPAGRD
jgi:DivIVA domain-containing protein